MLSKRDFMEIEDDSW